MIELPRLARAPLLKWAGGKRWLVCRDEMPTPNAFDQYIEPFFGGGAPFFHLRPRKAILADLNRDLLDTYLAVRDDWREVERALTYHAHRHSEEYYYEIRSKKSSSMIDHAARFLYLNRTCWNGLYRVNQRGIFNVPIGTKTKVIIDGELELAAEALAGTHIICADFAKTLSLAVQDDFIYIDPPYTVKHNKNGFLKYNQTLFSWDDQVRLRDEVVLALKRGVRVLVSNAAHDSVISLYRDVGEIVFLERASIISGKASGRKREQEIIVKCF